MSRSRTVERLAAVQRHLVAAETVEALPADYESDIPDPRYDPERAGAAEGKGRPGNMPRGQELQGYGIMGSHPPPFDPIAQAEEAFAFYQENGYVVVNSLSQQEVADLNVVCDGACDAGLLCALLLLTGCARGSSFSRRRASAAKAPRYPCADSPLDLSASTLLRRVRQHARPGDRCSGPGAALLPAAELPGV